jgi:regulator of RNase E activity RraA
MKKVKYSGTIEIWPGDILVYGEDGGVISIREATAGVATKGCKGIDTEVEIYEYNKGLCKELEEEL